MDKIFFIVHVHKLTLTSSQYNVVVILQTKTFKGVGEFFNFEINLHAHEDELGKCDYFKKDV
jgi:hypothetical protein